MKQINITQKLVNIQEATHNKREGIKTASHADLCTFLIKYEGFKFLA